MNVSPELLRHAMRRWTTGVTIVGFGSFQSVKRKARTGRNPQTGETIKIQASKTVRFRPGKAFKKTL